MNEEKNIALVSPPKGRLIWGGIIFVSGFLSPLLIPLVINMDLSTGLTSLISGLLALGIPELFMIIAVGILGKQGFQYLKDKIFSWIKKYGPPDTVSILRYRIGLILFSLILISGLALPYIWNFIPFIKNNLLIIVLTEDILLIASLLILGGDFWDKLRSLFIYNSRAVLLDSKKQKPMNND
jgi:hypothetical protein